MHGNDNFFFDKGLYWNRKDVLEYNKALQDASKNFDNVKIINTEGLFCDDSKCSFKVKIDGRQEDVYLDSCHLNYKGSKLLAPLIFDAILEFNKD